MILKPQNEKTIRHVLANHPETSNEPDIKTAKAWKAKREKTRARLLDLLGEPAQKIVPAPRYQVLEEIKTKEYRQLRISYLVEPGEEVRAYLLIPPSKKRLRNKAGKAAAVLCLHGTAVEAKDTQLGAGKEGRDYGRLLARNGFIVLAPDHLASGERLAEGADSYDTAEFYKRHPNWSAVGKAVWDSSRALDILQTVREVDATRIGCVGHSLGGYGSIFSAAFDERIRAAVSSCGLTTWQDNPQRYEFSRDKWYVHIPKLRAIFDEQKKKGGLLPVEMHEFAALIAPRAFLNISGMTDTMYGNNETLPEVGLQLNALWEVTGAPQGFSQLLFGAGHDVPHYSQMLTLGWFQHWLTPADADSP
ncbi:MAG TPA: alpha/beta fold hydrolase [Abditibacteriaceae bacterium]|jgi:dienelactone hydrolase